MNAKTINAFAILIIVFAILACFYAIACFRVETVCARLVGSYEFTDIAGFAYCIDEENKMLVPTELRWYW